LSHEPVFCLRHARPVTRKIEPPRREALSIDTHAHSQRSILVARRSYGILPDTMSWAGVPRWKEGTFGVGLRQSLLQTWRAIRG
jgi:hypothetical protein